ncbi:MAG: secondary thiamine-phosphate synthase enzyme YjbQ [Patescibacteria group bacterium]
MSIFTDKITLSTIKGFCEVIDITDLLNKIIKKSKIKDGILVVSVIGSTAGLTTIEAEPNLIRDFQELLKKLIPEDKRYHHDNTWGEANGFSHLRASLIGPSLSLSVSDGKLDLGNWQQIVFCDFDNRARRREIIVKIIGEQS